MARLFGNLVFTIGVIAAVAFWLWAMASLVRASGATKQSGFTIRHILALSTTERISHPAYPYFRDFLNGMLGFTVAVCFAFVLSFWFGTIR